MVLLVDEVGLALVEEVVVVVDVCVTLLVLAATVANLAGLTMLPVTSTLPSLPFGAFHQTEPVELSIWFRASLAVLVVFQPFFAIVG